MKKRNIIIAGLASLAVLQSASAVVIIGGTTGNGNFDNVTPASAFKSDGTTPITLNSTTVRATVGDASIGSYISIPEWTATRSYYRGGANGWGYNTDMPGSSSTSFKMLSGDSTLVSTTYNGLDLDAGDVATVAFDMICRDYFTTEGALPASCGGMIDFGGGQTFTWASAEGSVSAANTLLNFSKDFVLTDAATEATMTIYFSTGRGDSDNPLRSPNESYLDNVSLTVVPEPTTLGLLALAIGLISTRFCRKL